LHDDRVRLLVDRDRDGRADESTVYAAGFKLPNEGKPAWIVPPLAHLGAGSSGLAADPRTGMPERFAGRLLICDFRGGSVGSSVRILSFERVPGPSSMPADLVSKLSRRELRDLVAWLGSLRAEGEASLPASLP
jgi:hypothetical protein